MSRSMGFLLFATANMFLQAGIIFGWPAIEHNLIELGELQMDTAAQVWGMATMAVFFANIVCGYFLDKCGIFITTTLSVMLNIGGFFMLYILQDAAFIYYGIACSMIAIGGLGFHCAQLKKMEMFENVGFSCAVLNAAMDASAVMASVICIAQNEIFGNHEKTMYGIYSLFLCVLLAMTICTEMWYLTHMSSLPVSVPLEEPLLKEQIKRPKLSTKETFVFLLFQSLFVFSVNFYIGSVNTRMDRMYENPATIKSWINPIMSLGFLSAPVSMYLLDHTTYKVSATVPLFLNILGILLQLSSNISMQFLALAVISVSRSVGYTLFYGRVGQLFGFENFGTIVSTSNVFNIMVSFIQIPIDIIIYSTTENMFVDINLFHAGLLLFCVTTTLY